MRCFVRSEDSIRVDRRRCGCIAVCIGAFRSAVSQSNAPLKDRSGQRQHRGGMSHARAWMLSGAARPRSGGAGKELPSGVVMCATVPRRVDEAWRHIGRSKPSMSDPVANARLADGRSVVFPASPCSARAERAGDATGRRWEVRIDDLRMRSAAAFGRARLISEEFLPRDTPGSVSGRTANRLDRRGSQRSRLVERG